MRLLALLLALFFALPAEAAAVRHKPGTTVGKKPGQTVDVSLSAVVMRLPLNANGALIPDDAGTVAHWIAQPRNLLTKSEALDDATAWSRGTSAVTADQVIAPDGTLTADYVSHTIAASEYRGHTDVATVSGVPHASSLWVRASANSSRISFGHFCSGWPTDGVTTILSGPGNISLGAAYATVTGLSQTQWTHIQYVGTTPAASCSVFVYPDSTSGNTIGWGNYVWGVQLEVGSSASGYQRTDSTIAPGWTDTKGNAWTMNGAVPAVGGSGPFAPGRAGAGPFSDANYYYLGSGSDPLDFTGDYSLCAVFFSPSTWSGNQILLNDGAAGVDGYAFQILNSGALDYVIGTSGDIVTGTTATLGAINVGCVGRAGSTGYAKLNFGAIASGTNTSPPGTTRVARIGRNVGSGYAFGNGVIYEAWFSSTPASDALFTSIAQRVLGMLGARGEPISVTRSTTATYLGADGQLYTSAPGVLRIQGSPVAGSLSEPSSTNALLRSSAVDPTTYPTIWSTISVTSAAPTVTANTTDLLAPDGTQTASKVVFPAVGASSASAVVQNFTGTAAPWSQALWVRTAGGSTATIYLWFTLTGSGDPFVTCNVTPAWSRCTNPNRTLTATTWNARFGVDTRAGHGTQGAQTVYVANEQAEALPFSSSDMISGATSASRSPDWVSVATPAMLSPSSWTAAVTASANWAPTGTTRFLFALGGSSVPNAAALYETTASSTLYGTVYDASAALRYRSVSAPSSAPHRFTLSAGLSGTIDRSAAGWSALGGAGTGVMTAMPATTYIGFNGSSGYFGGVLSDFRLCSTSALVRGCQ
jgi:hypothetical protein